MGLEIGSRSIKVALVRNGLPLFTASAELPAGTIERGRLLDPDALTAVLVQVWEREGLPTRRVRVAITNQELAVRTMQVPDPGDAQVLEQAVRLNAKVVLDPIDPLISDIGYTVLARQGKLLTLAVVAASREMLEVYRQAVGRAKLDVQAMEVAPLAEARALDLPLRAGEDGVIVNVGADLTTLAFVSDDVVAFMRVIPLGGEDITRALITLAGTWEGAEQLKIAVGVGTVPSSPDIDPERALRVQNAMLPVVDEIIQQITDSVGYYLSQSDGEKRLGVLCLTGGGARLAGLGDALGGYLSVRRIISATGRGSLAGASDLDRFAAAMALSGESRVDLGARSEARDRRRRAKRVRVKKKVKRTIPPPYLAAAVSITLGLLLVAWTGNYLSSQQTALNDQLGAAALRGVSSDSVKGSSEFMKLNVALARVAAASQGPALEAGVVSALATRPEIDVLRLDSTGDQVNADLAGPERALSALAGNLRADKIEARATRRGDMWSVVFTVGDPRGG